MLDFLHTYQAPEGEAAAGGVTTTDTSTASVADNAVASGIAPAQSNIVADAKSDTAVSTETAPQKNDAATPQKEATLAIPTAEEMKKVLANSGLKKNEIEKLSSEELQKRYDAVKPIEYAEFKLPDGVKLDEKILPDIKNVFSKARITQDQAQQILENLSGKLFTADALTAELEKPYKLWQDTQTKWQGEVKADPEIGGANMDKTLATIATGIDALAATPDEAKAIRQAFAYTGAGNNPMIIRLLARAFAPFMEGGHASGKPAGGANKSAASVMYPNMGQQS